MFDINKSHDANKNAEDLKYYVRSIALLGEMKRAGCISQAEYDYLKSCFMAVAHVIKLGLLAHKEPPLLFFARIEVLNHYTHSFLSVSQVSASSLSSSLQPAHWYCSSFRQRNEGSPKRRRIACRSSLLIRKRSA